MINHSYNHTNKFSLRTIVFTLYFVYSSGKEVFVGEAESWGLFRQFYMQKTLRNASILYAKKTAKCVNFICKKHCKICREICRKVYGNFLYFFKLFRDDFKWNCVQGWERRDPGQNAAIPIGVALKILVSAARCQRKARLAPKLVK